MKQSGHKGIRGSVFSCLNLETQVIIENVTKIIITFSSFKAKSGGFHKITLSRWYFTTCLWA